MGMTIKDDINNSGKITSFVRPNPISLSGMTYPSSIGIFSKI